MTPTLTSENTAWNTAKKALAVGILSLLTVNTLVLHAAPSAHAVVRLSSNPSSAGPASGSNAESAAFAALKTGMSYKQVVAILGSKGEELVSSEISGVKTVLYEWKGTRAWASKNAVFENDKLISKTQFGGK